MAVGVAAWCAGSPGSRSRRSRRRRARRAAARTASTATWTLPSVRFLKPTGIDSPEPSWRWIWLSTVRAPIAPQQTASEMYCGVIGSRNSQPTGRPSAEHLEQQPARDPQPGVDVARAVEMGVVDQPLPADRRARLLEVDPHRHAQVVRPRAPTSAASRSAYSRVASTSWTLHGPTTTSRRSSRPSRIAWTSARPRSSTSACSSVSGSSSISARGRGERHQPLDPLVANRVAACRAGERHVSQAPQPSRGCVRQRLAGDRGRRLHAVQVVGELVGRQLLGGVADRLVGRWDGPRR